MDVERGKVGGESYLSHTGACGVRQRSEEQLAGVSSPSCLLHTWDLPCLKLHHPLLVQRFFLVSRDHH